MTDALRRLLARAELENAGPITAQETARWPTGAVDHFVAVGFLRPTTPATSIRYDGCDHDCVIEPEIMTHAVTGEQFGVHRCMQGECGLVRIPLDDLRQWKFELLGAARAAAHAIDASGQVVEDVPGRLVALGPIVNGDICRDIFLARGLAWSDAGSALADARRLKASAAPLVLVLADLPESSIWPGCKPAVAALLDITSLDRSGLKIDLGPVVARPTKPHLDAMESEWLTVTEAAKRMLAEDVIDDLDLKRAKPRVSTAATRGQLRDNGKTGADRRIESGSLAKWMLELRKANLAEDIEVVALKRRRQPFR